MAAAPDPRLAQIEDELYGVAPADFVAHRAAAARAAKDSGEAQLATAITALRKPTAAAWALDAFARARPAEIGELLDVGGRLRDAVARGDGDAIRDLMRERTRTVAHVAREVRRHADADGAPLSASVVTQVEQTLRAATSSEEDGELLRRGVLATALDEGGLDVLSVAAAPRQARARGGARGRSGGRRDGRPNGRADRGEATTPDRDGGEDGGPETPTRADRERRDALARQVAEAEQAVTRAEDEHADVTGARRALEAERDALRNRLDDVDRRLRAERERESDANQRLREARAGLRAARAELRRADP